MIEKSSSVFEMRWFSILDEIKDGSIVFFESWTEMSSENCIKKFSFK